MSNHNTNNVNKRDYRAEISFVLNDDYLSETSTANSPSASTASTGSCDDGTSSPRKPEKRAHRTSRRGTYFPPNYRSSDNRRVANVSENEIASQRSQSYNQGTSDEEDHHNVEDTKRNLFQGPSARSASNSALSVRPMSKPIRVVNDVPCEICGMEFYNQAAVKRHKKLRHATRIGTITCPECTLVVKCEENLARHARVHGPGAEIGCERCPARFVRQRNLTNHMREVHAIESTPKHRPRFSWICPIPECTYASTQQNNVYRHYGTNHAREYPYKCDLCEYRAANRSNLAVHRATHDSKKV